MDMSKRARAWRRLAVAGGLMLTLPACAPSLEETIAQHTPAVEEAFAKLKALWEPANTAPPILDDAMDLREARVVLEGDASNALFINGSELLDPGVGSSGPGSTHARTVSVCREALRGEFYGAPKGAEAFMTQCARAEYAFVLRTHAYEQATILDEQSFSPGLFEGDVLLFRLADRAVLGGFGVYATNGGEVSVELGAEGKPIDAASRLNSDLDATVFVEIEEKLEQNVPGIRAK